MSPFARRANPNSHASRSIRDFSMQVPQLTATHFQPETRVNPLSSVPLKSAAETASDISFVMLSIDWQLAYDNPTSKHRIAETLAQAGYPILWIEAAGMRSPSMKGKRGKRDLEKIVFKVEKAMKGLREVEPNLWATGPLMIPLPGNETAHSWNCRHLVRTIKKCINQLNLKNPVVINYLPILDRVMEALPYPQIYHCVDRWDAFPLYDAEVMHRYDQNCCENADLVLASSDDLVTRCRAYNQQTIRFAHGVDYEHFAKALNKPPPPEDLPEGPIIGYFGRIESYVDLDMLAQLARVYPDAKLVLIGNIDVESLPFTDLPNVHCLGPRPFERLPDYVAHFTVGLIPFAVTELTIAVNPIKLREMLAAGCPVVSTELPEASLYDTVKIAKDASQFIKQVGEFLNAPLDETARQAISDSVRSETWKHRCQELVDRALLLLQS